MQSPRTQRPRRARRALSALACLLLAVCGAWAVPARDGGAAEAEAAGEARLRVFDEVWEQVRARYYDPELRGLDWPLLRRRFRPLAAGARDQQELYAVLRRMLAHLHDPHTRLYAPGESADWRERQFLSVGVSVCEVGGEVVVNSVERGSEAEGAGLKAGDTLVSVDGVAARALVARRLEEQDPDRSRSAAMRVLVLARIFEGARGSVAAVVFRDAGGRERSARLRREVHTRLPALRVRRTEGGRVGVVQFNVFTPEIAAELVRALRGELGGVRGLVIDLRDNGGGETEAMTDIASAFLPAGRSLGRFLDRAGRVGMEPHTRSVMFSAPGLLASFREPVVVLTGARTASASEVFAAALRESGRATALVGEGTCGCVLGIRRRHTLPDGGVLDISELDYLTAGGTRLEGRGVEPDERIPLNTRDLRAGHDAALKRAVEILKAALKK